MFDLKRPRLRFQIPYPDADPAKPPTVVHTACSEAERVAFKRELDKEERRHERTSADVLKRLAEVVREPDHIEARHAIEDELEDEAARHEAAMMLIAASFAADHVIALEHCEADGAAVVWSDEGLARIEMTREQVLSNLGGGRIARVTNLNNLTNQIVNGLSPAEKND